MNIEIISGSPRPNSVTKRVALHLLGLLRSRTDHNVNIIHVADWPLPALQSVFTTVDSTPAEYRPLSERIFAADAFILVTPEYNGSYTGALKNLLDHFPKQHHKPFGIVTASPGALGGMRAAQELLLLVPALFGIASPYLLIVPYIDKKFSIDGQLIDGLFTNSVNNFVNEFLWLAGSVVDKKMRA